jgi:predicted PurR-regulated permease PerM
MLKTSSDRSTASEGTGKGQLWVVGAAIGLVALASLLIVRPFISAGLWAAILCFSTWPLFSRLVQVLKGRRGLAALLATFALAATIGVPFLILGSALASNLADLGAAVKKLHELGPPPLPVWVTHIPLLGAHLTSRWRVLTESSAARVEQLVKLLPSVGSIAVTCGKLVGSGILQILLSLFIAFFFYRDGHTLADALSAGISRSAGQRGIRLLDIAGNTIRAVVYGIIGTAFVQGLVVTVGFLIAGIPVCGFVGLYYVPSVHGSGRTVACRCSGCLLGLSSRFDRMGDLCLGLGADRQHSG